MGRALLVPSRLISPRFLAFTAGLRWVCPLQGLQHRMPPAGQPSDSRQPRGRRPVSPDPVNLRLLQPRVPNPRMPRSKTSSKRPPRPSPRQPWFPNPNPNGHCSMKSAMTHHRRLLRTNLRRRFSGSSG